MKNHVYIIVFLICSFLNAQNEEYHTKISELNEKMWDHYYYHRDSAYHYANTINELALEKKDISNQIKALLHLNGIASYHYDLQKSKNELVALERLLGIAPDKTSSQYLADKNMLLYYKGAYSLKLYEYEASRKSFEKIIQNVANTPDSLMNGTLEELSSVSLSFIGKTFLEEGKFSLAKQFYNKDIRGIMKSSPENIEALYDNYNLLAEVYKQESKYREANKYLLKTYKYNRTKKNWNSSVTTAFNIAQNYNQLGFRDSSLYYLSEAKMHFNENPTFLPKYHLVKAEIHAQNNNPDLALSELHKAIKEIEKNSNSAKNINIAIARNKIGEILKERGEFEKAIENYNLGLKEVSEIKTASAFSLKLLKNKSVCLNAIANQKSYLASSELVDLGISKLDSLKSSFKNHTDKLVLIDDIFPLFESGMDASFNLFKSTGNQHYIDTAFKYAEKSKSTLLLEALMASKATKFANIPEEITERESQLKSKILFIEKQIERTTEDVTQLHDELFDLRQAHRNLVIDIERNYPAYFNLKYNNKILTLSQIQEELNPKELLVSYFYGNNTIYLIATTKNAKHFERIVISPELEGNIIKLQKMLSNPKSHLDSLTSVSHTLYQKLLEPVLNLYSQEKIIIVPDGLLNYIPFGSLVTDLKKRSFLIQDKTIGYNNSANLLSQLNSKKTSDKKLLAFAPSFDFDIPSDDIRSEVLGNLPHSKKEVTQILESFEGTSFVGKEATLKNFTSTISDYNIFHLATHANFNDENPEYSYLAFTPQTDFEDLLFVKDLYNLSLNVGLVTLSACESGIGELKRGEGFISLARGFFYSGANSISSTLWKVNDASSAELMNIFYKNLADGHAKDFALKRAKIEFLDKNSQNALSHPYYWSGYIISGNTKPLATKTSWIWFLLGPLAIIVCGIFLYNKKQSA